MQWQDIPTDKYLTSALALNPEERERLAASLAVLPDNIIDAHTHIARQQDVEHINANLLNHIVSTFPVYSLEMAQAVKRTLWHGKQLRSARMAHAVVGYYHIEINKYLEADLPTEDFFIGFGLQSDPAYVSELLSNDRVKALKMYFHSVDPPQQTIAEVFPEAVIQSAEALGKPIILHLPKSLPDGLNEVCDIVMRHPRLNIILAHLGGQGGQILTQHVHSAFKTIAELPTVFMDTAFIFDHELVHAAIQAIGPSRILFGTDEPLSLIRATSYVHPQLGPRLYAPTYHWSQNDNAPKEVIDQTPILLHIQMLEAVIYAVDRDPKSLQAIFHDNALRIFGPRDSAI